MKRYKHNQEIPIPKDIVACVRDIFSAQVNMLDGEFHKVPIHLMYLIAEIYKYIDDNTLWGVDGLTDPCISRSGDIDIQDDCILFRDDEEISETYFLVMLQAAIHITSNENREDLSFCVIAPWKGPGHHCRGWLFTPGDAAPSSNGFAQTQAEHFTEFLKPTLSAARNNDLYYKPFCECASGGISFKPSETFFSLLQHCRSTTI